MYVLVLLQNLFKSKLLIIKKLTKHHRILRYQFSVNNFRSPIWRYNYWWNNSSFTWRGTLELDETADGTAISKYIGQDSRQSFDDYSKPDDTAISNILGKTADGTAKKTSQNDGTADGTAVSKYIGRDSRRNSKKTSQNDGTADGTAVSKYIGRDSRRNSKKN